MTVTTAMSNDDPSFAERVAATAAEFERWCCANKHYIGPGGFVFAPTAAVLLGLADGTLVNWRCEGFGPAHYKSRGGRTRYRIIDIATFTEQQWQDGAKEKQKREDHTKRQRQDGAK